jgi:hypothetical protein
MLLKSVWKFLKILKLELPYDKAIHLLGIKPKEIKSQSQKYLHFKFIVAVFMMVKTYKQWMHPSRNGWVDKDIMVHVGAGVVAYSCLSRYSGGGDQRIMAGGQPESPPSNS